MRAPIWTLLLVMAAAPALAAPTCWDRDGHTVRCEAPGALPVGSKLSPEQAAARRAAPSHGLTAAEALALAAVVGGLFALIVMMPRFDGRWDDD